MTKSQSGPLSRPLGVAETLLKRPVAESEIASKMVILTGELATLTTANGRWCLLDAFRLLSRIAGDLVVALPHACELRAEVADLIARAWCRGTITLAETSHTLLFQRAHAILNVGNTMRPDLPWTSINSEGWVARVSSRSSLPPGTHQANPIAALMAASFGVTEVFKRILNLPSEVAPLLDKAEFSLFELTASPTSLGPPLPDWVVVSDVLLAGAGAIGNAIALLLSRLRLKGRLHVIDRQDFGEENLGTCLLMERIGWCGSSKAERLAAWLGTHSTLAVTGEKTDIEQSVATGSLGGLSPATILNALDDPEARRHTQRLWPDVIIDGGINEVGAAVIQHRRDCPGQACLICWFAPAQVDERELQSRWTGLPLPALEKTDRLITEEDVASATPQKRDWLRDCQRRGKTVCSVITEAQMTQRLGIEVMDGFRPSVPFVAAASATLVVAATVKSWAFPGPAEPTLFQMSNLFLGPHHAAHFERRPSPGCLCVTHRHLIERLRGADKSKAPPAL